MRLWLIKKLLNKDERPLVIEALDTLAETTAKAAEDLDPYPGEVELAAEYQNDVVVMDRILKGLR